MPADSLSLNGLYPFGEGAEQNLMVTAEQALRIKRTDTGAHACDVSSRLHLFDSQ